MLRGSSRASQACRALLPAQERGAISRARVRICTIVKDGTPLEPEVAEHKYYAPGIGLILEVDLETGERVELTGMTN